MSPEKKLTRVLLLCSISGGALGLGFGLLAGPLLEPVCNEHLGNWCRQVSELITLVAIGLGVYLAVRGSLPLLVKFGVLSEAELLDPSLANARSKIVQAIHNEYSRKAGRWP